MKASEINKAEDAQRYVEGCLIDLETGISTKSETMDNLLEYTERIIEVCDVNINFAVYLTGHSKETIKQMFKDFIK